MNKKIKALLSCCLVLLMTVSLFAGCGSIDTNIESTEDVMAENLTVVGFSQVGSESVWRTANSKSIQMAISQDNGYFLLFDNARQNQENQIKAIRNYISQRVDYIVLSPVTESGWDTVLSEAKAAGIPVILVDRKVKVTDPSLYTTWIGEDSYEEGVKAGVWLEGELANVPEDQEVQIIVLEGTAGATATIGRTDGFNSVVRQHPNWKIVASEDAEFTTAKGEEVMAKLIKQFPDADVVISQNDDMTFGALKSLNSAGYTTGISGDIKIVSFDAVHEALELVQQGIINVDVECNPDQGGYILDILNRLSAGETVDKSNVVDENVFTIDNVNDYIDDRIY